MSSCIVNALTLIEHDPNAISVALEIIDRNAHRVALRFEDPELLGAALLGTLAAGAIAIPIDRRLHPDEVERMLAHSRADLLLWDAADPRLSPPCPTAGRESFLRTGSPPDRSG